MAKSSDPLSAELYPVIPIFCFDKKIFGDLNRTPAGSLKCGPRRAKFILESVADLRQQLREQVGTHLFVALGDPYLIFEDILRKLEKHFNNYEEFFGRKNVTLDVDIVCQLEYATEEREAVIDAAHVLRKYCNDQNKTVTEIWGSMMYSQKKSPFDWMCRGMPNDFRDFTVRMTKRAKAEPMLPIPENLPFPEKFTSELTTFMPTLSDLGYTDEQIEEAETIHPTCDVLFRGGETAALARVHEYVWEKNMLVNYKHRRRYPILQQQTSKLSPWLAHGCLSPRFLVAEAERACINKAERHKYNAMITWELLQREYCKFYTVKHGKYIFLREGPVLPKRGDIKRLRNKRVKADFDAWTNGQSGYPLVDASMRELKATGWISNRSRLICASFLFADLEHDWTRGADWFESHLIDYDVYSNWVNWCISTGLNVGKRYHRCVPHLEGKRFDTQGEYVKRWVPELTDVPPKYIHKPWKMDERTQEEFNCRLGLDYPNPIRDPMVGELRRKQRFLRRKGMDWSEEGKVVSRVHLPNRRLTVKDKRTSEVVEETTSTQDDDDWFADLKGRTNEGGNKGGTWNVSLDDAPDDEAPDDEWSSFSSKTTTTYNR